MPKKGRHFATRDARQDLKEQRSIQTLKKSINVFNPSIGVENPFLQNNSGNAQPTSGQPPAQSNTEEGSASKK